MFIWNGNIGVGCNSGIFPNIQFLFNLVVGRSDIKWIFSLFGTIFLCHGFDLLNQSKGVWRSNDRFEII